MIKSTHVVPRIHAGASGVSYCVTRLCDVLATEDQELELHLLAPAPASPRAYEIHAHRQWPFLKRLGISPEMRRALVNAARTAQIMHSHSVWMMPNIYPASAVKGTGCQLVVSPHGCLSEYMSRRSRWVKKAVWAWGQASVLRNAACLHATAESEHRDIRRAGLGAPVAVIPNGVDVPSEVERRDRASGMKRLLYLGRIHPQKGIDMLLHAWARLEKRLPDWELEVIGPDDDAYSHQMKSLARELGVERVSFPGPAYGAEKEQAYGSSELFVLPTHSENFGLVVAEALAHGIPVIATKGAPWAGLEREQCGWWVDIGVDPLAECLEEAMSRPGTELHQMGARGRQWMKRDFSWEKIGKMMHETYEWVLGGGPPLEWIRTD